VVHPARLSRPTPCNYRNDGECDVPQYCSAGDYNDCGDFADCADHHCPSACKCEPGSAANGILTLGSSGMCEAHCSKEFGGTRFCGSGAGYMDGDFIDCTGCGTYGQRWFNGGTDRSLRVHHRRQQRRQDSLSYWL